VRLAAADQSRCFKVDDRSNWGNFLTSATSTSSTPLRSTWSCSPRDASHPTAPPFLSRPETSLSGTTIEFERLAESQPRTIIDLPRPGYDPRDHRIPRLARTSLRDHDRLPQPRRLTKARRGRSGVIRLAPLAWLPLAFVTYSPSGRGCSNPPVQRGIP